MISFMCGRMHSAADVMICCACRIAKKDLSVCLSVSVSLCLSVSLSLSLSLSLSPSYFISTKDNDDVVGDYEDDEL